MILDGFKAYLKYWLQFYHRWKKIERRAKITDIHWRCYLSGKYSYFEYILINCNIFGVPLTNWQLWLKKVFGVYVYYDSLADIKCLILQSYCLLVTFGHFTNLNFFIIKKYNQVLKKSLQNVNRENVLKTTIKWIS
jgi:hypothetical protein